MNKTALVPEGVPVAQVPLPPRGFAPKYEEFCRLYAGNPLAPTFGSVTATAKAMGMTYAGVNKWLERDDVQARVGEYMLTRADDARHIRHILEAAGFRAAVKLIEALHQIEDFRLLNARQYIAMQQGVEPEAVILPEAGTQDWSRIERAVTDHNRTGLILLRDTLDRATTILSHAVGQPYKRVEVSGAAARDESELAQRVRSMAPTEQQNLLRLIDDLHGALKAPIELQPALEEADAVEREEGPAERQEPVARPEEEVR